MKKSLLVIMIATLMLILTVMGLDIAESKMMYTNELTTAEQLKTYAEKFVEEEFGMEFDLPITYEEMPIEINATIYYNEKITFNKNMATMPVHYIEKVLIHELCHYYLYEIGSEEYDDGQLEFEQLIGSYGSVSNYNDEYLSNMEEEVVQVAFLSRLKYS